MRLIDKIGAWVLHEACRTATDVAGRPDGGGQSVAGAVRIGDHRNGRRRRAAGVGPRRRSRLELEITETLLLGNTDATMATLRRLKAMGVSIVMDDFGTGYSSLSYLWKFPFDKIKIDRSFMESFEKSGRDVETVVKTIIALGREMHMRVTVEGVETAQQVDFLYDADADQVQGFYFGQPVPASEVSIDILKDFSKTATAGKPTPNCAPSSRRADRARPQWRASASVYCSGLKPTSSLPPPISSTGRLIIEGCASISASAFFSVTLALSLSGSFLERRAGAVEQRLPAGFLGPAFEPGAFDAGGLVVVEGVVDAVLVEPGARLLHGVAVLDAVDGDGHD